MFTLTQLCPTPLENARQLHLSLTAEERCRRRLHCHSDEGESLYLKLPRGITLQPGDRLRDEDATVIVTVHAKPEPTLKVMASTPLDLLRAAYHLGNRHVPLEIHTDYLRLGADSVVQTMLEQRGLTVTFEVAPFCPERGAYHAH
ncbi:urease accessory protein UreE [Thermosynechococcus vestitus]|uniref:Urease accessory protein UreE n=1 Tax=Thermosynechococcus vestitus (strain NIES-2133 / IAM M-273 / BP-1) TaxID=197221 RepID=UREE_THEVB|nr:urease accessory protein UreE [Thermosynechococcus vestitus]Q8DJ62.1 RecName: Full=Urease accessory protein UreE [Thermosynechococcus vestitus BP-1]BAC08918.1 urease accessory protein E [Thermosynechococcus vestitus BP-1]BAY51230.1 urease accessory protein E [Thermostichus vulcanus NIES-2134]